MQHDGVAGRRAWPKIWECPLTLYIMYTKQQDKATPARVGINTCERPTVTSRDLLGPNIQHALKIELQAKLLNYFLGNNKSNINHVTGLPNLTQDAASPQRVPSYSIWSLVALGTTDRHSN